ncbi:MAG: ADP-ribosyltransferase [Bacteriovoracaceae bacterium]
MRTSWFIFLTFFIYVTTSNVQADIFSRELECSKLTQSKFVTFFNKDIKDKIISITPDFCLDEAKNDPKERQFNQLFASLKKRAETITPVESDEYDAFSIMKSLIMHRLWNHLTNKQRHILFGNRSCMRNREIYLGFMDFKSEKIIRTKKDKTKNEEAFKTYQEICEISSFTSLLPYIDKGLLLEYFLVVNLAKFDFETYQNMLCDELKKDESVILGSRFFDSEFNYTKFKKNADWILKTDVFSKDGYLNELSSHAKTKEIKPDYFEALKNYSGSSFEINNCLRGKDCTETVIKDIANVNSGIKAITKKEVITYRGVSRLPEEVEKKLKVNCIYRDPAFTSTSLKYETARSFIRSDDGYLFVIRGKSGAYIQDVSHMDEEEILYPSGTKFLVVDLSSFFEEEFGSTIQVVYLREVEPGEKVKDCSEVSPKSDNGIQLHEAPHYTPDPASL